MKIECSECGKTQPCAPSSRTLCEACWGEENPGRDPGSYYRTGRPKGTTQYDEAKTIKSHRMTPTAHEWLRKNRDTVERLARMDYEIQFKALVK